MIETHAKCTLLVPKRAASFCHFKGRTGAPEAAAAAPPAAHATSRCCCDAREGCGTGATPASGDSCTGLRMHTVRALLDGTHARRHDLTRCEIGCFQGPATCDAQLRACVRPALQKNSKLALTCRHAWSGWQSARGQAASGGRPCQRPGTPCELGIAAMLAAEPTAPRHWEPLAGRAAW